MNTQAACPIRPARSGDADQVTALLADLGYPGNQAANVRQRLATWAAETTSTALVAERHGRLLGIIGVTAIPYLEREGRWGRIVALVVSRACRGQGIGRQLVEAAEKAAVELGCVGMEVTSARDRTEAHPFYRALGYQERGDRSARYLKDLAPGPADQRNIPRNPPPTQS